MKIAICAVALLILQGCVGASMYQGLTADQISAAAKDNKAVYQCADIPAFPGGVAKVRSMVIDTGVIKNGSMVADTCDKITFTNETKPKTTP